MRAGVVQQSQKQEDIEQTKSTQKILSTVPPAKQLIKRDTLFENSETKPSPSRPHHTDRKVWSSNEKLPPSIKKNNE